MVETELVGRLRNQTSLCFERQNHGLSCRKAETLIERERVDEKLE